MANDEMNNNQNNPDTDVNGADDTNPGDILDQLKADSASLANIYKLESKMLKIVTNADKTLTKEHKLIMQSKKNLDGIAAAMNALNQNVTAISTTMSSVDDTLRQVLETLRNIDIPAGRNRTASDRTTPPGTVGSDVIQSRIAHEEREQERLTREHDEGNLSDQDYQDQMQDLQDSIDHLREQQAILNQILADVAHNFDSFSTAQERYNRELENIQDQFVRGDITADQVRSMMENIQREFDETQEAIQNAQRDWDQSRGFRFSNEGEREKADAEAEFERRKQELTERFNRQVPDENGNIMSADEFSQAMLELTAERNDILSAIESKIKVEKKLDEFIDRFTKGNTYDARTGTNSTASSAMDVVGAFAGEIGGQAVGEAIGTAIGGPVGTIVGGIVGEFIGSKIEALAGLIGDRLDYLANHSKKSRDEILKAGFEKIRSDVKDMATYSIEIYETATKDIYAAWDKNLGQITATQGYTKEALNSLQDAVAIRLQEEGYGATVDASQYLDQLANTLNANLGGTLAEAFAAQNMILQKAVPEVDLSASAAQFAAIYANANRQTGTGEETMIAAMNEIAGAAKALETVTNGNNQFLKETSNLLNKATEVVAIAGGNADQIADLTAQMMASEAAITSVAPQLSGFTSDLVNTLMSNNDATAVSLRAIMHDINSNIGISATSFMQSFMEDTQGTLSTAFAAIQRFITENENEAARQEFLQAMESVFGINGSKLAQLDFSSIADLIAQVDTSTNMAALTNAENLVRSGETTTAEEQLVANTANQLLATNAISSTIDNKLMRKLEANELTMERAVYQLQATQSVDLAENTLTFFTRIGDLIMSVLDPLGLFDMLSTTINAATSTAIDAERYIVTSTLSTIGSTVADSSAGITNTIANTVGGATAVMAAAQTKSTDAMVAAVELAGVSPTFEHMMLDYSSATKDAQAAIAANSAESNAVSYAAMEQQARQSTEYQLKQDAVKEQDARYEEEKAAAREQQKAVQEAESIRNLENHDNIILIKDALDNLNYEDYLSPILDEHRTHTEQIKDLQAQSVEIVKLLSTIIEYNLVNNPEFASTISYDERSRIMDNGYINSTTSSSFV